jgi:hypothetical protein
MPSLKHLPADAAPETICEILASDGALILDDVIPRSQVDRVMAELWPYIEATPVGRDPFTGFSTTRTGALVARSPATRELVMHPALIAACDTFLKDCDRYHLHLTQVIRIRPGQPRQALHRDRAAWGNFLPMAIEPQLNTIWAMTEFTQANGATQVVPGSPSWVEHRKPEPHEIGYAEMSAGSVLVYSGSVIHGGGENQTEGDRVGINITYSLGWLRQEENQYLSCPPQIARTLDRGLQRLLGYQMSGYALGYFTPPLPPGEGPEVVPPEWSLGEHGEAGWGGEQLLSAIIERQKAKAAAAGG